VSGICGPPDAKEATMVISSDENRAASASGDDLLMGEPHHLAIPGEIATWPSS
jgi:hypothetical protein